MTPPYAAALLAFALTACSAGGGTRPESAPTIGTSATGTPPATTPPATTPPTAAPTPAVARPTLRPFVVTDLADGERHYAHLKKIDQKNRTLTVDVVQFLTGKAAQQAAEEDGQEPFEYYVRNQNPKLRMLTLDDDLKIVVNTLTAGESGSSAQDTPVSLAKLASYLAKGEAQQRIFWFTLQGGVVVTLHEQFVS